MNNDDTTALGLSQSSIWLAIQAARCAQVLATDVPSPGQLPRTGGTQVVVTVMDINDNAPVITEPGI